MAFDTDRSPRAILDELATHPHAAKLCELVHALAISAFDERRTSLDEGLDEAAARIGVDEAAAETSFGNVLRALRKRDTATGPERTLLGALIARGVAGSPPFSAASAPAASAVSAGSKTDDTVEVAAVGTAPPPQLGEVTTTRTTRDVLAERRVAEALAWISAHTVADPLSSIDAALGGRAGGCLEALSLLVRGYDEGQPGAIDRPSAILSTLAIARAEGAGQSVRSLLAVGLTDPMLTALVGPAPSAHTGDKHVLSGEVTSPPRSSLATVLLTPLLPFIALAKLFGRFALRVRRPAVIAFSREGVTIRSRFDVLGKTLREREVFIAAPGLVRAAREVRYPSLATYLGIACLLIGSYLGLRLVLDGFKSGSPEYLGLGVAVLVAALALDYALTLLPARSPSSCRIVLEPRRGRIVAFADVDRAAAEVALQELRSYK